MIGRRQLLKALFAIPIALKLPILKSVAKELATEQALADYLRFHYAAIDSLKRHLPLFSAIQTQTKAKVMQFYTHNIKE